MGLRVLTPLPGVLKFVLLGRNVPEGRVQPSPVVDLVNEVWQPLDHVFHRFVFVSVHLFVLEGLEETLGVGVVIRVALAAHRAFHPQRLKAVPVLFGRVLAAPVGVKSRARLGKTGRAWLESVVTRNRLTRFGVRASSRMILAIRLWLATIPRRRSSRVTRRYP